MPEINSELLGSRNEGRGGGGIVRMEFGGSAFTQSKQDVTSYKGKKKSVKRTGTDQNFDNLDDF